MGGLAHSDRRVEGEKWQLILILLTISRTCVLSARASRRWTIKHRQKPKGLLVDLLLISKARSRKPLTPVQIALASRIASGSKVSKSDKTGAITYGYVGQKFSGGATTQQLWGGYEFGSNNFKQFPVWSGRQGRGSKGWFVYPTLRTEQPYIVSEWQDSFNKILKEF
jgi:hypothetical protein